MHQWALDELRGLSTPYELEKAMRKLCAPYGEVASIEFIPVGEYAYLCWVRLSSEQDHTALSIGLGGSAFGDAVQFRIPIRGDTR